MQFTNIFVILFIIGTAGSVLSDQMLEYADYAFRRLHGREIPAELSSFITAEDQADTCAYEDAKYRLWIPSSLVSAAVSIVLLFSGFYPLMYGMLQNAVHNVYLVTLLFAFCASVPGAVVSLPFELYGEFVVEKRYGFSTMTVKLWIADQIKSLIMTLVVASFLLCVMTLLFEHVKGWWWMLGTVYVVFSLAVSFIYPRFIAPLFNKFTPVGDGELRTRIDALMEKTGFRASGVFIMDASKRSSHSNAYFTGIGKSKRVVLYDTLVNQLTTDELEAVLGHELGHYKKHHIVKRLCVMIPLIYAALYLMSLFISCRSLYTSFGFDVSDAALFPHMKFIGLFLLSQVFGSYGLFAELVSNYFSRRDEYAADAFSKQLCGSGRPLVTSLIKLNKENKSEILVPRIYSIFRYSHPTLMERIHTLEK